MGKGQRKTKVVAKTTRVTQKEVGTVQLVMYEQQYAELFNTLSANQSQSGTAQYQVTALRAIALAEQLIELNKKVHTYQPAERQRLHAVYLSKQAKPYLFMRRFQECAVLLKTSFNSSTNIITSFDAFNHLLMIDYFNAENAPEQATYLLTLYQRGLTDVTKEQKDKVLFEFKHHQQVPDYKGQYQDVLNSFFMTAISEYTKIGKIDEVVKAYNTFKEQIGTLDFDRYIKKLSDKKQYDVFCEVLSGLDLSDIQRDKYLSVAHSYLGDDPERRVLDLITSFSHKGHLHSMARLSVGLCTEKASRDVILDAFELAQKALAGVKKLKNKENIKTIHRFAYHTLAMIYDYGLLADIPGYQQSDAKALFYYTLAAEAGSCFTLQDLSVMYREGQGVPQDLDKAHHYLDQAIKTGNPMAFMYVPLLYSMRVSINPALREQLLDEGISKALAGIEQLKHPVEKDLLPSMQDYYLGLAFLYLMKDSKLIFIVKEGIVSCGITESDLSNPEIYIDHKPLHQQQVVTHLEKAISYGSTVAIEILASMHMTGFYLERNLAKSKQYIERYPPSFIRTNLSLSYELQSATSLEDGLERDAHLQAAFNYYSEIEIVCSLNGQLDALFKLRSYMDAVKQNKSTDTSLPKLFQRWTLFSSKSKEKKAELSQLLENSLQQLGTSGFSNNKDFILNSVKTIHVDLQQSNMSVPDYKSLLPKIHQLQEAISGEARHLSNEDICTLIGYFQRWPVQNQTALVELSNSFNINGLIKQEDIIHALLDISYDNHIFTINSLRLLLLKKIDIKQINHPRLLAQLLYCCASQLADPYPGSVKFMSFARSILPVLNACVDKLHYLDKSQIDMAIQFLEKIDDAIVSQFAGLQLLIKEQQKIMSQEEQVTVSKQQSAVFRAIKARFPTVQHEPVVAGRRPDFLIAEKNLVIFYNGPGHYHFDQNGQAIDTNLSTKLAEQTLHRAGYAIVVISFEEYASAKSLDRLVKEKLSAYLPQQVVLSANQNAWFKPLVVQAEGEALKQGDTLTH